MGITFGLTQRKECASNWNVLFLLLWIQHLGKSQTVFHYIKKIKLPELCFRQKVLDRIETFKTMKCCIKSPVDVGLYKHWYTVVSHPQRLIILNNSALYIMICQNVENLRWEYNPGLYFMLLAQLASGKSSQQFKKFCLCQCPWGSCISWQCERPRRPAWWGDEVSMSVADSYQSCWACQFRIFGCQDCTLMRIMEMCVMNTVSSKKKLPVSSLSVMSYPCASPSKSVKYQICAVLPKVSWIGALVLMFGLICEPLPELCLFTRHAIL